MPIHYVSKCLLLSTLGPVSVSLPVICDRRVSTVVNLILHLDTRVLPT